MSGRFIFLLLFSVFSLPSFLSAASSSPTAIAPERDIVTSDTSREPEWKDLWDKARELTRQQKFSEAARLYSHLLSLKKNIEEASWEYSLVLIRLSEWEQASVVLDGLLEIDSQRIDYLLHAGLVALKLKEYARSATSYRLVYQKLTSSVMEDSGHEPNASGKEFASSGLKLEKERTQIIEALSGLVAALRGGGKNEEAFPLMEELSRLRPDDHKLLHQLARHAVTSKRLEKARIFYEKLIARDTVEDQVLLEAADVFDHSGRVDQEVPRSSSMPEGSDSQRSPAYVCWEKYLQRHPDYLPFQEKIAHYFIARGEREAALPHLLVLLNHNDKRDGYLLQVGAIYFKDLGRPDKALSYYEEYFQRHPENQEIEREIIGMRSMLAHDFASRVDHESAGSLWKELAPITPNRLAIYKGMVELLERTGRHKELREALGIIHQYEPGDREVMLRLAELALDQNDSRQAEHFVSLLSEKESGAPHKVRLLMARARLADQSERPVQALNWYDLYLEMVPEDLPVRRRCMELSAALGLIDQYEQHYQLLRRDTPSEKERLHVDLQYVRVLLVNGLATRARTICQHVLDGGTGDKKFLAEYHLALAEALHEEGNIFEAEQVLRQMVAEDVAIDLALYKLVELSLEDKEFDLARTWFTLLSEQRAATASSSACVSDGQNLMLLQAKMLAAMGKSGKAVEIVATYRNLLAQQCPQETGIKKQADLLLSSYYLQDQQVEQGQKLIKEVLQEYPFDLEALILARQFTNGRSEKMREDKVDDALAKTYGNNFLRLMGAARLEQKYGAHEAALKHIRMALQEVPESVAAQVTLARILREQGDSAGALKAGRALAAGYPQELGLTRLVLEEEFKTSSFNEIITKLVPSRPEGPERIMTIFPDIGHLLIWQKLILARALWAERQWVEAVAVYDAMLQPSVDKIFQEKIAEQQIQLVLPPPRQSFWHMITFTTPVEPDRLTQVMEPRFFLSQRGQQAGRIGAELYASYRWQQLVARELSARRAVAQGDYYQAMKEYQEVIEKNPSPESLFDLAGIYSRLGLLGKEALLYEEIGRDNPDYPDLAQAVQRNTLKRKPKGMIDFGYSSFAGRDGYLDIQQTKGGGSFWMLPTLRQEVSAGWSTIHAVSTETQQELWRNRFLADYSFYPHYSIDFTAKIGGDKIADGSDDEQHHTHYDVLPLYHIETRGRLGDELHGFVRISQDVVDDTLQALKEGITKREMESGITLDLLPRLFCGGEYLYGEYSDANYQHRYHIWVSYTLFTEPTLLQVTYGQELLHNAHGNTGRDLITGNQFAPGDHPYWSPGEYWQNLVSVHFEHQLAADVLGRSAPSYYTLDYSFGYEAGGYDSHHFGGDIFLEMSRHCLLNSSFNMVQGGPEIRKEIALSLIYRW